MPRKPRNLYAYRTFKEGVVVLKCAPNFDLLGAYVIIGGKDGNVCTCEAPDNCKHLKMLPMFKDMRSIDATSMFYCWDDQKWVNAKLPQKR